MLTFSSLNYNWDEIAIQNVNNVYTDGEFQLKLPAGNRLLTMPKMKWTKVRKNL